MVDLKLHEQVRALIAEVEKTCPDQRARACELLSEAFKLARAIKTDSRVYKFIEIADTCAELNLTEESLEVLNQTLETVQEMSYDGGSATQLSEVGKRFVARGLIDRGFNLLGQALELAKTIEDVDGRDLALCDIACAYGKTGQHDFAFEIAALIEDGVRAAFRVFSPLAYNCIQLGQHDRVLQIVETTKNSNYSDLVVTDIIDSYATYGDYDHALQFISAVEIPFNKASSLAKLAKSLLEADRQEEALTLRNQALAIAETVEDQRWKSSLMKDIAQQCEGLNNS